MKQNFNPGLVQIELTEAIVFYKFSGSLFNSIALFFYFILLNFHIFSDTYVCTGAHVATPTVFIRLNAALDWKQTYQ